MHPGDRKSQQGAQRATKMSCWTKQDQLHINVYNLQLLVRFSCLPVLAGRVSNSSHQTIPFSKLTSFSNIWKISFFDLGWETQSPVHEKNVLRKPSLGLVAVKNSTVIHLLHLFCECPARPSQCAGHQQADIGCYRTFVWGPRRKS